MKHTLLTLIAATMAISTVSIATATASVDGVSNVEQSSTFEKRSKPRVPGGSGCDDPRDLIEHPECQP